MSVDEFNKKLDAKILAIQTQNKPLELAVRSVMTLQARRIFVQAKKVDGSNIGEYVKKPVYISPDSNKSLPKFPLKGKSGETKFKNGKEHKTGYFENFLDFKKEIGRNKNVQTVDLFLTGDLQRNWANAESLRDAKPNKISNDHYNITLRNENYVKTLRYGNVFGITPGEKEAFLKVAQFEFRKALQ